MCSTAIPRVEIRNKSTPKGPTIKPTTLKNAGGKPRTSSPRFFAFIIDIDVAKKPMPTIKGIKFHKYSDKSNPYHIEPFP